MALYGGEHGNWPVFCRIQGTILLFLSVLPVRVPANKQLDVLDYLNRINWEIAVGNFEMEPSDGEVRFRTSIDCADGEMTLRMIAVLLYRNLMICDRYLPGLFQILVTNMHPCDALRVSERTEQDEAPDAGDLDALLRDVNLDPLQDDDDG